MAGEVDGYDAEEDETGDKAAGLDFQHMLPRQWVAALQANQGPLAKFLTPFILTDLFERNKMVSEKSIWGL